MVEGIEHARRAMYRTQILAAAEHEFAKTGFSGTKVTAIAATADLSLATVYKHFAGKDEIWDALHADRMSELLDQVAHARDASAPPLEQLLAGVAAVATYLAEQETYLDMNLWAGAGWARTAGHGVQQTVWSAGVDTLAAGIAASVGADQIPAIDPRIGAGLIVATLQVWLAEWVNGGRVEEPAAFIEEMVVRLRWMLAGPERG